MVRRLLGVILVSLAIQAPAQAGFPCTIVGGKGTAVENAGKRHDLPVDLDECEGTRVIGGEATLCFVDGKGRLRTELVRQGELIRPGRNQSSRSSASLSLALRQIIGADPDARIAGSRGSVPLPSGKVLLPGNVMRIDVAQLPSVQAVEVREGRFDGPVVVTAQSGGATVNLRTNRLRAGQTYWIRLVGDVAGVAPVEFAVAPAAERLRAKRALAQFDKDHAAGAHGRAVLKADWLLDAGYPFDARQILAEAGLMPNP